MIYKGAILNLRRDRVEVKGGKTSYREIIEHNGAVALVAITNEGKAVMVRQYRKPCEDIILEIPAGKIDQGEDVASAAVRELKEETGYTAGNIEFLTKFYVSCGYSEEQISLYLCTQLTAGEPEFDEDEDLEILEIPMEEIYRMCMRGEIVDSKTMVGILMAKEILNERK